MSLSQEDFTKKWITEFERSLYLRKIEHNAIFSQLQTLRQEVYGDKPPHGFTRRSCEWLRTKEETMIMDCVTAIETNLPADVRLTDAQTKLKEAFDLLADYNDNTTDINQ